MKKLCLLFLIVSTTYAQMPMGNSSNGQTLYKKCIACHGKKGEGKKSQKAPRLAGQYSWYTYTQLINFKAEERINPKMLPFIKNMSKKDFADLASYIEGLK